MNTSAKIGNSAGVILPKELLAKLRAGVGDTLYVSETPHAAPFPASSASKVRCAKATRGCLRALGVQTR